jgi:REP element-mobilizing transposase RayT
MNDERDHHHRRSLRLRGYDYSRAGLYFVTICVEGGECLFGSIVDDAMQLNDAGQMVWRVWEDLPGRFLSVTLDAAVVMPNHFHGIVSIVGAPLVGARPAGVDTLAASNSPCLGSIIGAFRSMTTNEYIYGVRQRGWSPFRGRLWQRNYFEHIICDEFGWERISEYILDNPRRWSFDRENPMRRYEDEFDRWLAQLRSP